MNFALVNPNWTFEGSTYFGCREPHYPLELLFAFDQIRAAGHQPLLIDAQVDDLSLEQVRAAGAGIRTGFPGDPDRAIVSILALPTARAARTHAVVCRTR